MRTLYFNGDILTMNDSCKMAQAVLTDDETIVFVGDFKEAKSFHYDQIIDLKGKTMMPAFIDPHSHFTGVAQSLSQCDLSDAVSFSDIVLRMQQFIEKNSIPEGEYVFGRNYDHNFLKEKKHPTKEVLNQISDTHKIIISHASSHMGCCNQNALDDKNITDKTLDPKGGKIGRVAGSMEPNGYLEETAFTSLLEGNTSMDVEDLFRKMKEAQTIYASYGITTMQDGMVPSNLYPLLKLAASKGVFYLDLVGYLDLATCGSEKFDSEYHNHFKVGGYKMFLDGSPQGKTAWMLSPYKGEDSYCGYPTHSDEEVDELLTEVLKRKKQVLVHCNGDAAAEQYIRELEKLKEKYSLDDLHRPVMIHAQLVQKNQLDRMKKLRMIPSFFTSHTYYWGDIHIQNFGFERASSISPARSAQLFKMPFTFHQDSPVVPCNMMKTIWCAVNRITRNGIVLGEDEKIDVYTALKAVTIYGAYQYFEEDKKGSIEVGKKADFVILEKNPLKVDPKALDQIQVLETIHEGRVVFKKENEQ